MSGFERKSFEQIVNKMITWSRGVSDRLTDFRVGSKIRTLYESVAIVLEETYDDLYRSIKKLIEENLYSIFGFDRLPATYSIGTVTFGLGADPESGSSIIAETNILIPAGTIVETNATASRAPIKFRTSEDVLLLSGTSTITASVVCFEPGAIGNVEVNTIVNLVTSPSEIATVTNALAFTNGRDEETPDEQKYRFEKFLLSRMRGTKETVEYGALTVQLYDANGLVTERVVQSRTFEDLTNKLGEVDLYIWNGFSGASSDLITEVNKVIYGYYDENGNPIYGYKPAGIKVNIYPATIKSVYLKISGLQHESYVTLAEVKASIEAEIDEYFLSLKLGQTLVHTSLSSNIKNIAGVIDFRLDTSIDNVSFSPSNVTCNGTEILTAVEPIIYA